MKTVLIVDDNANLADMLAQNLEIHGWYTVVLTSANFIQDVRADVALIDWHPYGPEAVKRCKKKRIPYAIWSGTNPLVDAMFIPKDERIEVISTELETLIRRDTDHPDVRVSELRLWNLCL